MKLVNKGISVFYTDEGQGSELVFLHGFLESTTMWRPMIERLKLDYRCIAIDLLGHGHTDALSDLHTMDMMADQVNNVLEHLQIENAIFIGHSMGGYVLLALAESHPLKFSKMCLLNSTALADGPEKKLNRVRAAKIVGQNKTAFIGMSINNLFLPQNSNQFKQQMEDLKSEATGISEVSVKAALYGMKDRPDRTFILSKLKCPKIVILGKEDSILPLPEQLDYLNRTDVEIEVLEGGHMLHIENMVELTYKIFLFIEKK